MIFIYITGVTVAILAEISQKEKEIKIMRHLEGKKKKKKNLTARETN